MPVKNFAKLNTQFVSKCWDRKKLNYFRLLKNAFVEYVAYLCNWIINLLKKKKKRKMLVHSTTIGIAEKYTTNLFATLVHCQIHEVIVTIKMR